jgi:hypothetical protein
MVSNMVIIYQSDDFYPEILPQIMEALFLKNNNQFLFLHTFLFFCHHGTVVNRLELHLALEIKV